MDDASYLLRDRSSEMIPTCFNRQLFFVKNALAFRRTELSEIVQLFVQSIVIGRIVVKVLIQELREENDKRRRGSTHSEFVEKKFESMKIEDLLQIRVRDRFETLF